MTLSVRSDVGEGFTLDIVGNKPRVLQFSQRCGIHVVGAAVYHIVEIVYRVRLFSLFIKQYQPPHSLCVAVGVILGFAAGIVIGLRKLAERIVLFHALGKVF